jgi:hypothetical protein
MVLLFIIKNVSDLMPRLTDLIPNFLRTPFGIRAGGSTQISMISLSETELFAGLNRSVFVQTMQPVSRAEFKDHLLSATRLGNMRDTDVRLGYEHYRGNIERALAHVYQSWGMDTKDVALIADTLVRDVLGHLPRIKDDELKTEADAFRAITASDEEYEAQMVSKFERQSQGDKAAPFQGV